MQNNTDNISWKEALRLSSRGYKLLFRLNPRYFIAAGLGGAVDALSPYISIWLSAKIINELAGARRSDVLWPLAAVTVLFIALSTLASGALSHWKKACEERMEQEREYLLPQKMMEMDFAEADRTETRDLLYQIRQNQNWSGWGPYMLMYAFDKLVPGILGVLGAVGMTVSLFTQRVPEAAGGWVILNHPLFILAAVLVLILVSSLGPACYTKARSFFVNSSEESLLGNRIFSCFGFLSYDLSKALDRRMYNQQKIGAWYMKEKNKAFSADGEMARLARGPGGAWAAAADASEVILTAFVYVFVCLKSWAGAFGVGSVTQYVGAVTSLGRSVGSLVSGLGCLKNNAPYMVTYFQYLDIPNAMYQGSLTTEKRSDRQYQVEFRDVSFKYPGSETYALRHVSTKFTVGSRLAVVGENGSGKTTFIKLLCRLYDPQEGQILLNGIDIRKYRYDDYMDIFSVVFQDFQLISQSLGSNVAGRRDYNREKAEQALRDAGFDTRLSTLTHGLDTQLYKDFSEEGVEVSGGEAQKIAIARALYKDAPFIILDEPTAALDPIAEAEIYSRFNDIVTDKTAIYISHRLSSCRFCDEIAVFDHGRIVQTGTHDSLVSMDGKYRDLWNAQAQYYTDTNCQ